MSLSLLIGFVVSFGGLIVGYKLEHGIISSLFLLSPFVIVFGGTAGAVIASYGLDDIISAFKVFFNTLSKKNKLDPEELIKKLAGMTDRCRREGLLVLDSMLKDESLKSEKYLLLKEAMILVMDIKNSDDLVEVLQSDVEAFTIKRKMQIDIFVGAAGYSPTMGVIGTVMGLVQVLSNMSDAESLTSAIAVAFIATLYGVVFANMIYMPIANQLKINLKLSQVYKQMIIDGIVMISSGENASNLENKLSLYYQAFPKCQKKYEAAIK